MTFEDFPNNCSFTHPARASKNASTAPIGSSIKPSASRTSLNGDASRICRTKGVTTVGRVKTASETKSKGKKISIKNLSPAEIIKTFEDAQLGKDLPDVYVGDTVRVGVRISEGNKERVQPYEGVVIAKRHGGIHQTITVRRIFQGIGVESPNAGRSSDRLKDILIQII